MNIGYALVSTDDRNPDRQLTALKRAGCERIFTGKAAGANVKRPELTRCVKSLAKGGRLRRGSKIPQCLAPDALQDVAGIGDNFSLSCQRAVSSCKCKA